MKLYTKTGDKGKTGLFGGQRVPKNSLRIETYGTIDELNSILGIVRVHTKSPELLELYQILQNTLFNLGSDLATPYGSKFEDKVKRINESHISFLEGKIDEFQSKTPEFKNFILPGGSAAASYLHLARTVCRRAERHAVALMAEEDIGEFSQKYLNRLSDFFFICARYANVLDGVSDIEWSTK
jgi:cob(I)alamin adenosyltransferase